MFVRLLFFLTVLAPCSAQATKLSASERRIHFAIHHDVTCSPRTTSVTLKAWLPQTLVNRQIIEHLKFEPPATRRFEANGESYVEWTIAPQGRKQLGLVIRGTATLQRNDLQTARKGKTQRADRSGKTRKRTRVRRPQNLAHYLRKEKFLDSKNPKLLAAGKGVFTAKKHQDLVEQIHEFVTEHMETAGYNPGSLGAVKALAAGSGDCTEYSDLFVALCRSKGIPARVISGYTTPWTNVPQHNWAEVWLAKLGWVSFDPFRCEWKSARTDRLQNVYLQSSRTRSDKTLRGFHYYHYVYRGAAAQVKSRFVARSASKKLIRPPGNSRNAR